MNLRKYLKVFEIGLQNTFVYRWNFFLRSMFGLIPLAGTILIWQRLFQERGEDIGSYSAGRMIFYFLLILLAENLVSPTEDEWQIASDIREGNINAMLSKPVDYMAYRAALFLSSRLLYTGITILPVAGALFIFRKNIELPPDALTWALTLFSLISAAAIQFFIAFSLAMMAFWILEISTIVFLLYSFEYYLCGKMFPLNVMPEWVQAVMQWLPFTYELYFPVAIFMGEVQGDALWKGLAIQTGWVGVTFIAARRMWAAGVKRYESVGG